MPLTITSFYTFIANTKIKSAEMNTNWDAIRGHRIPIHESTQTSADNTYDLGSSDYQWRNAYIGTNLIIGGSTFTGADVAGATNWVGDKFPTVALTATSNDSWTSTANNNPLGLYFDDAKVRGPGVERVMFKNFALVKGDSDPDSQTGSRFIPIDQYGNYRTDINIYTTKLITASPDHGTGFYTHISTTAKYFTTEIYTQLNNISYVQFNSLLESVTSFADNSSTTNVFNQKGDNFLQSLGSAQNAVCPLQASLATNELHTGKFLKITPFSNSYFGFGGQDYIYNAGTTGVGAAVMAGGTFYPKGEKITITTQELDYTPASYTGSKGARVARYLYKGSGGTATSVLTCTAVSEPATLAVSGVANTTTMSIGQNPGTYNNGTIVRITGTDTADNMLNWIVSGADASGTSWVMGFTLPANYTTTSCFVEHYANAYPAATIGNSTLAAEYKCPDDFGVGQGYDWVALKYNNPGQFTTSISYVRENGSGFMYGISCRVQSVSSKFPTCIAIGATVTGALFFGDYCTGIEVEVFKDITTTTDTVHFEIDRAIDSTITLNTTLGVQVIKLLSDAPLGHHIARIRNSTGGDHIYITKIRYYVPKRPTFSTADTYLIQSEYGLNADYRPLPAFNTDYSSANSYYMCDQGVVHQAARRYFSFDGDTTWTFLPDTVYPSGHICYNSSKTSWFRMSYWGTGHVLRYQDANGRCARLDCQYSFDGKNWSDITTTAITGLTTGFSGTNPYTFGTTSIDCDVEATTFNGKFARWYNMTLGFYHIRFYNQTNSEFDLMGIDYVTPTYDFKTHHEYEIGGQNAYNEIQYDPLPVKKTYEKQFNENIHYNSGWFAVAATTQYTLGVNSFQHHIPRLNYNIKDVPDELCANFTENLYSSWDGTWAHDTSGAVVGSPMLAITTDTAGANICKFIDDGILKYSLYTMAKVNPYTSAGYLFLSSYFSDTRGE